jgi:hypothetical protein
MALGPPVVGPGAKEAALGGDDQAVRIGRQRAGDQLLADLGPVAVGRVDEIDAELHRPAEDLHRFVVVGGRAPDAGPGDAHGAEAQTVDGKVAADRDRAGGSSGRGINHGSPY